MKLHVALLLVAVLVACVSAKSVRPQNKALFKKLMQNRIDSASEKNEEDAAKLAQAVKLLKSYWSYGGYGQSYDWLCDWYPGDCELGCCRKSESEKKESHVSQNDARAILANQVGSTPWWCVLVPWKPECQEKAADEVQERGFSSYDECYSQCTAPDVLWNSFCEGLCQSIA